MMIAVVLFFGVFSLQAQVDVQVQTQPAEEAEEKPKKLTDEEVQEFKHYQFYLDQPALSIENIKYANDEEKTIEGQLSKDGKRVVIEGYTKRGRVTATVKYKDGTTEEVSRSSCVIDPVIPL